MLESDEFNTGKIITVKAKPNSSKSILIWDKNKSLIIAYLNSSPEKNKANAEIIKLFKKQLKLKVKIIAGLKSRIKKIKIL